MTKKILILGGGENQLPLIIKAKEMDLFVVVCDYNENCVGAKYATAFYCVDIYDYNALLEVAKKEVVDGIITNSEPVLHIMAKLTDELSLPSITFSIMNRFLNKNLMRDYLTEKNLSTVKYSFCYSVEEAIEFFEKNKLKKAIIKPVDNSASRGVFSVNRVEDIINCFNEAIDSNRRNNGVLIEEYIDGIEFTVDGISVNNRHHTLAISKKKHFDYNENVAYELLFSYQDEKYDYNQLRQINDEIIDAVGLPFGMTHSEYKYCDGQFYLIEASARGGGASISTKIVPLLTDIDTVQILIRTSLGEKNIDILNNPYDKAAVLEFFNTKDNASGIVKSILGKEILENNPNILQYEFYFKEGDYIQPATTDANRIGYYIAICDSKFDLESLMKMISDKVIIEL